ncbi:hypothetical protein [Halopiger xanaduensis]|uniref:Uncharacterized protein n=1 Tax=Halopiger xanaduensis (strain DSM 18323 / JCM 14033 / SH-6) TaxID=797210 RepID=F8D676_HALXS|nr:hypothetical protein [Halopiger xanaduensis]AEH35594.1 hypothetical protein Halxa_0958 [Halopiger xanaduensis SH-6]
MSDNDDNPEAQNENELAGLDAVEAAQQIHDEIRFRLEPANEYEWGDPEYDAFDELLENKWGSRLEASIPATGSDEPYLTLGIHLLRESAVIQQRTVGPMDENATYVGDVRDVLTSFAPVLEKSYIKVERDAEATELMREELARESSSSDD